MSTETVRCNECGAVLQAPSSARYITCRRCNVPLVVHRTSVAAFTEALPQPGARAPEPRESDPAWREMSDRLERLEMQNELARIDREWDMERERLMMYAQYGRRPAPSPAANIVVGVIFGSIGLVMVGAGFITAAVSGTPETLFLCVPGGIFLAAGAGIGVVNYNRAKQYQRAYQDYQARRAAVLGEPPPFRRDEFD